MNSTLEIVNCLSAEIDNLYKKLHDVDDVTQIRLLHIENLLLDIQFTLGKILNREEVNGRGNGTSR